VSALAPVLTDLTMRLEEGIAAYASHGRSVLALSPVMRHADFVGKGRYNVYDGSPVSFEVSQWIIGDQAGTHMDAPWHADGSGLAIDAVPLHLAYGPALRVDVTGAPAAGGISLRMLHDGLACEGLAVERGDVVLLRTGASDSALDAPQEYARTAVGLTRDAAEWLRAAGVKLVGIDCVSIESVSTVATADVHTNFLKPTALGLASDDVVAVVENLVNLDAIPSARFTFAGFPLPLAGAAGSPLRAVAITTRDQQNPRPKPDHQVEP